MFGEKKKDSHIKNNWKIQFLFLSLLILFLFIQIFLYLNLNTKITKVQNELSGYKIFVNSSLFLIKENFDEKIKEQEELNQKKFMELIKEIAIEKSSLEEQIKNIKLSNKDSSAIIEETIKSVVAVFTDYSAGSGFFIYRTENYSLIITNYHVVEDARNIKILTYENNIIQGDIIATSRIKDLAVIAVPGEYPILELADSNKLQVGNKVIAIGNPFGLSFTVTEGIISGLNREGLNGIKEYIQTDVSLNPGNSGGPLINLEGKVVGLNNFKIKGAENIGFALQSNSIKEFINSVIEKIK